ncbi:MAG: S9 family peptidase, partial [bacterium]|nr:S9 family peptidase [bacterium]
MTATDMHKLTRLSQSIPTPNGKFIVYALRNWNQETGKVSSHLEYIDITTKATGKLTDPTLNTSDFNPTFSKALGNTLFFLSRRSGKVELWTLTVPDTISTDIPTPAKLTNYPINITNFKISAAGNVIAFAAEVYSTCGDDLSCTDKKDQEVAARGPNTYEVYDKLLMRHWDHWKNKKVSHILAQKLTTQFKNLKGKNVAAPSLSGKPLDMMLGMETNSPVGPFGGSEMYSIHPDGTEVAFTGADRTIDEAWNTGWKIYVSQIGNQSTTPEHISNKIKARCTQPLYSEDGKKIAFLAMDREGLESDKLHIELYDRTTKQASNKTGGWDRSVNDYSFQDENTILAIATNYGVNRLYSVKLNVSAKDKLVTLDDDNVTMVNINNSEDTSIYSSSVPIKIGTTTSFVFNRHSYVTPIDTWVIDITTNTATQITNVNPSIISYGFEAPESFKFAGGNGEDVQGWIFKPINFSASNKYPLAFLIHGGPEGVWASSWSYGWNPQLWVSHGYTVVAINFHGSVGAGQKFTDLVRNDWGGLPYQDLMNGLTHVLVTYTWIDGERACAVGGSFGGYMVNWIQGHTTKFKCFVCHDGVFSSINMAYATDEIWFPFAENCPLDKVGCRPYDKQYRDGYFKFSPEAYVNEWKTPELVIQGGLDFRIPMSEATSIFTALQIKNVPSRFLHYDEENHWVLRSENGIKWYEEVLKWLDTWTNNKFKDGQEFEETYEE